MKTDKAEINHLAKYLQEIGHSLDNFLKFKHPDALTDSQNWQHKIEQPLPLDGIGIDKLVQELNQLVIPNGSPVPNPNFSAFITTGATTSSVLATTAASVASPQRYLKTAFNFIEELSLLWLAELCGVANLRGVYSSGGSVANLIALGGARQSAYEKLGYDPAADGLTSPGIIYASEECHHTIQRSAGVLGLGRKNVQIIPCDKLGRMDVRALSQAIKSNATLNRCQVAVVANAGTTNRGMIDPVYEIACIAREHEIWFHVDGAYGLPGILDDRLKEKYKGLEHADSVIVDPHKWLGAAVGVAATFVKDRELLQRAFTQEPADYLEGSALAQQDNHSSDKEPAHSMDDFGIPYFDYGVELSAPCRGIAVWAILKEIGLYGLKQRIIRHNEMARLLEKLASAHPNLEVLSPAELSICCFRYVDASIKDLNQFTQVLHRRLIRENQFLPSTTKVNGELAIRPCYIGARAELEQVEGLVNAVIRIGKEMTHSQ
ncbi:aminotransferase class V-fold PLP-dependent enzyme [Aliikangiella sp. G2MR2-5]|uniref:pyridoxal phosphate-dependent decarboxylase family protein n=1 Tax=Aliikangiella sp. G2MR2-5 TaxID=2788943 RepID=UPI0018AAF0AE|nr:aminotransferase class V-fold PLP-dependent enzyme [Aliikangiella sp. G2MR2-5]